MKKIIKKNKLISALSLFTVHCSLFTFFIACTNSKSNEAEVHKSYCIPDSLFANTTIDTVKKENAMGELTLTGQIASDEEKQVKVYALVSGRVKEVKVQRGDYVQAGQLLALVNSPDAATILSNEATAKFNLQIAKKNLDATEDLYKSGISSEKDYITAEKGYQIALSAYTMSKEILKVIVIGGDSTNVSSYFIKAPISGFIVDKKITEGQQIRPDAGDNLFSIADLKDVWVLANIFEVDIANVKTGYDADVTTLSYGDKIFHGKIDKLFNIVAPDTKVMNVRVKLDNPDYVLKPGMFARIVVRYPEQQTMLSVPSSSVMFEENKNFVLRFKSKCKIEMQPIIVFRNLNGRTYIKQSNLEENDLIVNRNGLYIFNDIKNYE